MHELLHPDPIGPCLGIQAGPGDGGTPGRVPDERAYPPPGHHLTHLPGYDWAAFRELVEN